MITIYDISYSDQDLTVLENSIHDDYSPVVVASQVIVLNFVYGVLFISATMLIIHTIGILIIYYLKLTRVFPTKPVYVVPEELNRSIGYVMPSSSREGQILLGHYGAETVPAGQYDTSFETEEMEMDNSMDNSNLTAADLSLTPRHNAPKFDPSQHAKTVQFKDVTLMGEDLYAKVTPLHTSSPRSVPRSQSQASTSSLRSSNPQLTDLGYSETKV